MITNRYQEILKELNVFYDEYHRNLNIDMLTIFNYVIVHYSRNVFHYKDNWKKIERIHDFDYDYINDTNCTDDLLKMEKEYRKFGKIFKHLKSKKIKKNIDDISDYKNFLNKSIDIMINKIIIPIRHKVGRLESIIKKYEELYPKKEKKSNKINYEALNKFLEENKMIQ
jgi:hypothetical protein